MYMIMIQSKEWKAIQTQIKSKQIKLSSNKIELLGAYLTYRVDISEQNPPAASPCRILQSEDKSRKWAIGSHRLIDIFFLSSIEKFILLNNSRKS